MFDTFRIIFCQKYDSFKAIIAVTSPIPFKGAPARIAFRGDYDAIRCGRAIEAMLADASIAGVYRPSVCDDFAIRHHIGNSDVRPYRLAFVLNATWSSLK
ncbi:unnamed protein product [Taenia asiatica]|uniref:COesterase domain-containing protein n=1 Tax=Taenia asiatica TaxID=60517 RepID=A0A0R3VXW6_TAEAS|nr:unnamed protein product [Taenia asiatica]